MADPKKPGPRMPPEHIRRMLEAMRDAAPPPEAPVPESGARASEPPGVTRPTGGGPAPEPAVTPEAAGEAGPASAEVGSDSQAEVPAADSPEAATRVQAGALHRQAIADIQAGQMET